MLYCIADDFCTGESDAEAKELHVPYQTNQPYRRHHAILTALKKCYNTISEVEKCLPDRVDKQPPDVFFTYNKLPASKDVLCQVHAEDYVSWLELAWESASASGNAEWFSIDTQSLMPVMHTASRPTHFLTSGSRSLYKAAGYYTLDTTTPIYQQTYYDAAVSAQTAFSAAKILLAVESAAELAAREDSTARAQQHITPRVYYALTTHPGHHAKEDKYEG